MKIHFIGLIFFVGLQLLSCHKGVYNESSCNGESKRRDIKIAIDSLASQIDTNFIVTDVVSFGEIEVPEVDEETGRQDIEKQVYQITAKVHKLSRHWDGDWKVKLTDGNDHFVNCESPNMGCEHIKNSIFFDKMEKARNWIDANKKNLEGKTVTITGVAFIDVDHPYPRNSALNELELHPILDIHF